MEVQRSRHETGGIAIHYLGQVGFLLQHRGLSVVIDPYLTDSVDRLEGFPSGFWVRSYPPPVSPCSLQGIDLVLCTHDHLDHTDPETLLGIAAASPGCRFAAPKASAEAMLRAGIDAGRIDVLNEGLPYSFRELLVEPVAAAHEEYETDIEGRHRFLGYLLHWDEITLFHAGDTVITPRLSETLSKHAIHVAFLPINGGDDARRKLGIVGNMNAAEAVALAVQQRFGLLVPTHYDLYPNNGAALAGFAASLETHPVADRPKFKAFQPGERIVYRKPDRQRPLAIIVGAGKTGRGFLPRMLGRETYEVAFVERSPERVRQLNEDGGFTIHFFGGARSPWRVERVNATLAGSEEALEWMSRAEIILTAIGEENVSGLGADFASVLDRRQAQGRPKLRVLVCENGASPAASLREAFAGRPEEIQIAEAAIFCSTIELPGTRLDIQSEACDELPYDSGRMEDFRAVGGMKPVSDFPTLLLRKIYTYNCLSASIAYLGAYKGYQWYADAAQDAEIGQVLDRIAGPLNDAIAKTFHIDIEEQRRFSDAALRKFRDQNIRDEVARNARNVIRKLGANDRLVAPSRLILDNGGCIDALALTIAAALLYKASSEKQLLAMLEAEPVDNVFCRISDCAPDSPLAKAVLHCYRLLNNRFKNPLLEVLEEVPHHEHNRAGS
ncbi:MAG: MBL fold metallo-hydrolase [Verrucomicrobiae bacterium]